MATNLETAIRAMSEVELPEYVDGFVVSREGKNFYAHCYVGRRTLSSHNLTGMTPDEIAADMLGKIAQAHAEMARPTPAEAEFGPHFARQS